MDGGMILDSPTIFGMMNGQLLGGGEAGSEAVVGVSSLMQMIQRAVASVETAMTVNYGGVTINVYGAEGQSIKDLADEIEERILHDLTLGVGSLEAALLTDLEDPGPIPGEGDDQGYLYYLRRLEVVGRCDLDPPSGTVEFRTEGGGEYDKSQGQEIKAAPDYRLIEKAYGQEGYGQAYDYSRRGEYDLS